MIARWPRWARIFAVIVVAVAIVAGIPPARHAPFDPDRWWQTRDGIRTEIIELQKLLLDVIRHPIS